MPASGRPDQRARADYFFGSLLGDAFDVVVHLAKLVVGHRLAGRHAVLAVLVLDRARERMERAGFELAFELGDLRP